MNRLIALEQYGQSIWLDYIRKDLIDSGGLKKLVEQDGLGGVTSNPSIFEKAIVDSTDYAQDLDTLIKKPNITVKTIYESLVIKDIQAAADILLPVYQRTQKKDGFISLEVSPDLAHNTQGTLQEAKRLWQAVNKPNLLIKVPGTPEGIPAIRELIAEGINVNVTLLFSIEAYQQAANAYLEGLEQRVKSGKPIDYISSVASFFVSRIDTLIDNKIDVILKQAKSPNPDLEKIKGKIAIANAKLAYQYYKNLKTSARFQALAKHNAQPQRVLWASTSTKNPKYSDVLYVETLIGPETVNTMPMQTMDAFRDHGNAAPTLEKNIEEAVADIKTLEKNGISLKTATAELLVDGVRLFAESFHLLLTAILQKLIAQTLNNWQTENKTKRLWASDASLWTNTDESQWTGWLTMPETELTELPKINQLAADLKSAGFTDVVVLGMGGSSLCPAMMAKTFGKIGNNPKLYVLDSTDPLQIKHLQNNLNLQKTFFIVSSKSGSTLEPNIFKQYFYAVLQKTLNKTDVSDRFLAITDPGTKLDKLAKAEKFKGIFHGVPSIGGRYSALSNFGMVPSGLTGVDIKLFLQHADEMAKSCSASVPAKNNPGVNLGIILGVCGNQGKNKITLTASPDIHELGAWLEQLLAESTGKIGKGLIPVDQEPLGLPNVYSNDRVFVYIRLDNAPDQKQDLAVTALEKSGQVVVRLSLADINHLGAELFRWEIATAVAGSILGINPFNQPDVEAAKVRALELTNEYEKTGKLSEPKPVFTEKNIQLFTDEINNTDIKKQPGFSASLEGYLRGHFNRIKPGDYVDLAAFIEMSDEHTDLLQQSRVIIRDNKKVATCLGFGPRFLHSTGQAYKGGPNTGVFLQITADHPDDIQVPDQKYTFGLVITAQAQGDFEVLTQRSRRALRVHLGKDVRAGLEQLRDLIKRALQASQ